MDRRTRGIVTAAFIAQGIAIGSTIGTFSLFVRPVADAFSATTLEVSIGLSLMTLMLGVCGVPIGMWLDRGTPRTIMFTGSTLVPAGLLLASQAESMGELAIACIVCGAGIPMLGPLTTAAIVGKATVAERGRALGIANLGVAVGAFVFALLGGFIMDESGWRAALRVFSGAVFAVGFIAVAIGIPKDLGKEANREADPSDTGQLVAPKDLFRNPIFLLLATSLGIAIGTNAGWIAHVASFLTDLGATAKYAGVMVGASQGSMALGTLALGSLADKYHGTTILSAVFAVQILCFSVLLTLPSLPVAGVALVVFGIAAGGFLPVFAHLLAEQFGARNLGRVMGLSNLFLLPFGFGLPMIAGALRDTHGSYLSTLMLCAGLLATGIVVLTALAREIAASRSATQT